MGLNQYAQTKKTASARSILLPERPQQPPTQLIPDGNDPLPHPSILMPNSHPHQEGKPP
jgi:hypothetical protein